MNSVVWCCIWNKDKQILTYFIKRYTLKNMKLGLLMYALSPVQFLKLQNKLYLNCRPHEIFHSLWKANLLMVFF